MLAREERERLLEAIVDVYPRRGGEAAADPEQWDVWRRWAESGLLGEEEEDLVAAVRAALARIVEAVHGEAGWTGGHLPNEAVASVGGAELILRVEILAGRGEQWPSLLESFAYLATLSRLGDEEARHRASLVGELVRSAGDAGALDSTPRRS